jgi:RNA polymerase sigma-70 factor (ECF subfamily)
MTDLEQFRAYLLLLARAQVGRDLNLDASDIVQQTLLEAHQRFEQMAGQSQAQQAAWLRQILAHNLADAWRAIGRAKRDVRRQRSLEDELANSSVRLGDWLAAEQSSPSQHMDREERALRLAQALSELPETQREALVLHYWQGCTLAQMSQQMQKTPVAIAGLLKRGLKSLRQRMNDSDSTHN